MKMGIRTPSPKRSISARTTGAVTRKAKAAMNPAYGKKGMGLADPERAARNAVYSRTTAGLGDVTGTNRTQAKPNDAEAAPNDLKTNASMKTSGSKGTAAFAAQAISGIAMLIGGIVLGIFGFVALFVSGPSAFVACLFGAVALLGASLFVLSR